MKQINVWFDDKEFEAVTKLKAQTRLNWKDFILLMNTHCIEAIRKGDLELNKSGDLD